MDDLKNFFSPRTAPELVVALLDDPELPEPLKNPPRLLLSRLQTAFFTAYPLLLRHYPPLDNIKFVYIFAREYFNSTGMDAVCSIKPEGVAIGLCLSALERDYTYYAGVLLHEFAHAVSGGHGKEFYRTLDRMLKIFNEATGDKISRADFEQEG